MFAIQILTLATLAIASPIAPASTTTGEDLSAGINAGVNAGLDLGGLTGGTYGTTSGILGEASNAANSGLDVGANAGVNVGADVSEAGDDPLDLTSRLPGYKAAGPGIDRRNGLGDCASGTEGIVTNLVDEILSLLGLDGSTSTTTSTLDSLPGDLNVDDISKLPVLADLTKTLDGLCNSALNTAEGVVPQ